MISKALQFMGEILEQFLKNRLGLDENKVQLNNLIEGNGSLPQENLNKLVISLINIEKETARPFYIRNRVLPDGNYSDIAPSQRYNLDVLISSNFDDYIETLKFLDAAILFFQANAAVEASSFSTIPEGVKRLEFEMEKITYHEMQSLWTAMGAKYQPSIIYKIRLITVQADISEGFVPAIQNYSNTVML